MSRADAIVIGAGPNGLAAAIRLAAAGRSVLVLEAAGAPGGAVRSEALTLPGFVHDSFSAVHPAAAASPVLASLDVDWVQPAAAYAQPLPGGEAKLLYRSLSQTAASLGGRDGERWAELMAPLLARFDGVRDVILGGFPPFAALGALLRRGGGLAASARLASAFDSAVGLGRRLFDEPGSREWLYGSARHGDAALNRPGSALIAVYLNLLGHAVGWPSARGGAQRITDALVARLQALGGELRCGVHVERVLSSGGAVTGVASAGERFAAPVVIACVMPHALARMAELPRWYAWALRRYVYGPPTTKVDWALDGPIPWADAAVRGAGTVHLHGLLLGQQSVADPSRAPAGKHTAWAYTHAPLGPAHAAGAADAHAVGAAARAVGAAAAHAVGAAAAHAVGAADAIEGVVERYAPGFRARILARHVLGPADLEARNANLVGGDVGGGSNRLRQVLFRPLPSPNPYATPLRGLYLGSAAAYPGGAVHGVPGDAAARAALRP